MRICAVLVDTLPVAITMGRREGRQLPMCSAGEAWYVCVCACECVVQDTPLRSNNNTVDYLYLSTGMRL